MSTKCRPDMVMAGTFLLSIRHSMPFSLGALDPLFLEKNCIFEDKVKTTNVFVSLKRQRKTPNVFMSLKRQRKTTNVFVSLERGGRENGLVSKGLYSHCPNR